jgi:hemerythrin superfamily protein
MARATSQAASDAPRDAIALLKQDHRTVEELFDEFADADEDQLQPIATRVCQLLTVHAQIEEELLYPAAKNAFEEEDETDLVNEAEVEHASAKELIGKIEGMTPDDEAFKATVTVLAEYIKHHVKEEESQLFPALRKTELDLKELGTRLSERKLALMIELGIEQEDGQEGGRRSTASGPGARQSRAGSRRRSASSARRARH